jgi:bifunctional enzyme CysN/CysC
VHQPTGSRSHPGAPPGGSEAGARAAASGLRGGTVWFTGLSGSGKSSVAFEVERRLVHAGRPAFVLDGDRLRSGLNADLGFDRAAREENVRRVAHVARLFAEAGVLALVSLISPYAEGRRLARGLHESAGLPFLEVYVSTPLEVCRERDPKGLYAKARRGELDRMTGIDDPYEPPEHPDLELPAHRMSVEQAADAVLLALAAAGLAPPSPRAGPPER